MPEEKTAPAPAPAPAKAEERKRPEKAPKEEKEEPKAPRAPKKLEGVKEDFRYVVRLANSDLTGARSVSYALTGIKGMGIRMAQVVTDLADVPRDERLGNLDDAQIDRIRNVLVTVADNVPLWMVNRVHDFDTGNDLHLFGTDVELLRRDDVNRMKMIRSYRGIRHEQGQKVRGQRTRSNGRTGLTVGVTKKAAMAAVAAAKAEEKGGRAKKEEPKKEEAKKTEPKKE